LLVVVNRLGEQLAHQVADGVAGPPPPCGHRPLPVDVSRHGLCSAQEIDGHAH
jgi:hypothetical protein